MPPPDLPVIVEAVVIDRPHSSQVTTATVSSELADALATAKPTPPGQSVVTPEYSSSAIATEPEVLSQPDSIAANSSTIPATVEPSPVTDPDSILPEPLAPHPSLDPPERPDFKRIIMQERGGQTQEFEVNTDEPEPDPDLPNPNPIPSLQVAPDDVIEITSDRQEFDQKRQVVTARGNAVVRLSRGVLTADRVRVNLENRLLVAEGDVALRRGDQLTRGDRLEYFFVQDRGTFLNARGEIDQRTFSRDTAPTEPPIGGSVLARPLSDRLLADQPVQNVTPDQGIQINVGGVGNVENAPFPQSGITGQVNNQRYEAEKVEFEGDEWVGTNVRITNDPFSPPELEIRADTATVRSIGPETSELVTTNTRLVFDQGASIPVFPRRFVFGPDRGESGLFAIGYDDDERGGLFIERSFDVVRNENVRFVLIPQYFVQRSLLDGDGISPDSFGLRGGLDVRFSDRTTLTASGALTSFDFDKFENRFRGNAQLKQLVDLWGLPSPHTFTLDANYRDRLFNGSLGFQTVQSSFGAVLTSPNIALGNTGINFSYQTGVQIINADTDRADLLPPAPRQNNRVTLTRYQGAAFLSRSFTLWTGEALPATPEEGLRYTPSPVVPYVSLSTGLTGVYSYYSSGDTQPSLSGSIGLQGQFGHFSRDWLDYTGFYVTYSQGIRGGFSPFLFDRLVDTRTLSYGLTQQIYGPFRIGFQSGVNLNTGEAFTTDYIFEYSRRTHNLTVRYNPVLGLASFSVRISDFNWIGSSEPFGGSGVRSVEQGVTRFSR
jgi:lipopolysaccharide export system protein LptA